MYLYICIYIWNTYVWFLVRMYRITPIEIFMHENAEGGKMEKKESKANVPVAREGSNLRAIGVYVKCGKICEGVVLRAGSLFCLHHALEY